MLTVLLRAENCVRRNDKSSRGIQYKLTDALAFEQRKSEKWSNCPDFIFGIGVYLAGTLNRFFDQEKARATTAATSMRTGLAIAPLQ